MQSLADGIRVYMRSPVVALLPAGLEPKRVSKKDAAALAAREAQAKEALARGQAALERLFDAGRTGDAAAFGVALAEEAPRARRRATGKLAARIQVKLVSCPRCAAGELRASVLTGQGKQLKETPLAAQGLEPGVAPRLLARA